MDESTKKALIRNGERLPDPRRYEVAANKYRRAGRSGLLLPNVSLGLWHNFGSFDNYEIMRDMIFTAFDHGITMFDLANNYGPRIGSAEENFGRILRENFASYRDEMLISTKAGYDMWDGPYGNGGSGKYLTASLDQSLKRLGVDYVDIFYHHRPDPDTPIEETRYTIHRLIEQGKALYAGISNYNSEQAKQAVAIFRELKTPVILNQVCYNLLNRTIERDGLKKCAAEEGFGLIVFSPLAQGLLSDRYKSGIPQDSRMSQNHFLKTEMRTPALLAKLDALRSIAESRGQTLAQLALSWILKDDIVTSVIIGASSSEQILENINVDPVFSKQELDEIEKICAM